MKILCLDGGGIRGIYAVSLLKSIEQEIGRPIGELFDCFAGTSTGSIIASAMALNFDTNELLEKYLKYGKKIFTPQAKVGIFKTIYSDKHLRRFLQQAFQDITLGEVEKPLLIPAVDLNHGNPYVHRTSFAGAASEEELSIKLWDAILSSCSAPVYFPPNRIEEQYLSIDGGLWANNPSLVALTDTMHYFKKPIEEIQIFSVGTGKQKFDFSTEDHEEWGAKVWLPLQLPSMKVKPKLFDLFLHISSESISNHCRLLLKDQYLRLNCELPGEIPFDETSFINELVALGEQTFQQERDKILQFFADI